jgi:hypothetical protein
VRSARPLVFAGVVVILAIAGYFLGRHFRTAGAPAQALKERIGTTEIRGDGPDLSAIADRSPAGLLNYFIGRLRTSGLNPGEVDAFRRALLAAEPREAVAAILAFLATGQDARTGETFEVGKGGELSGAPTLRVLLLDLLGRICRGTGSDESEVFSRSLLTRKTSADEWAVALRNIAWSAPDDRAFLAGKMREMLGYQPWRQQPSAGFFEAFDVIVFTREGRFVAELGEMANSEDDALKRAAAVALDRLSEMAPLDVMTYLNAHPAEFADKPYLRADYYSKADLSQSAQRQAVEMYLGRADVAAAEKEKLLAVFASPGTFAGENLLTSPPPPEDDPPERKAALRKTVDDWIKTNRFPALAGALAGLRQRLSE